jgi:hypothetical protein
LQVTYFGNSGVVRIDRNDFFNLNDLNSFVPSKRLNEFLKNKDAQDFVKLLTSKIGGMSPIITKRGKGGGTWAHKFLAMKFCMWLSKEFEYTVIEAYESGTTQKENWNFKRILAAESVKIQSEAVKEHLVPLHRPENERFLYPNNIKMIYSIVGLDIHQEKPLEGATEAQLEQIGYLERKNAFYLEEGVTDHQERKIRLKNAFEKKFGMKMISSEGATA